MALLFPMPNIMELGPPAWFIIFLLKKDHNPQNMKIGTTQESRKDRIGDMGWTILLPNVTLCACRRFVRSRSATGAVAYSLPSPSLNRI